MPAAAAPQPSPVIYVVEDDADVLRSLTLLLESYDLSVKSYASGGEFLADTPRAAGCLVLDCMPVSDGLELVERLRDERIAMPVVLITSGQDPGIPERARRSGVLAIIEKPFLSDRLLETIRRAFLMRPAST
ncbi:MAG TPA: response regulator [Aliidongia sp.]|nr:response regulator [Aliidongia sp.]